VTGRVDLSGIDGGEIMARRRIPIIGLFLLTLVVAAGAQALDDEPKKRVIGATAIIKETKSGLPFAARVDTGAASCSLHVERIEIENESAKLVENVGKPIRFLVKNEEGDEKWIESTIARVVRVRSAAQQVGEPDRRYKVLLTLVWEDFRKEILVTLNDRTEMTYPLLIGRNFLRGDFLVDVDKDNPE
jgi:hypothetical protein